MTKKYLEDVFDYKDFYPTFTVICDKCGGQHVRIDNSLGFSAESGSWGSIDLICDDCGNSTEIMGQS